MGLFLYSYNQTVILRESIVCHIADRCSMHHVQVYATAGRSSTTTVYFKLVHGIDFLKSCSWPPRLSKSGSFVYMFSCRCLLHPRLTASTLLGLGIFPNEVSKLLTMQLSCQRISWVVAACWFEETLDITAFHVVSSLHNNVEIIFFSRSFTSGLRMTLSMQLTECIQPKGET